MIKFNKNPTTSINKNDLEENDNSDNNLSLNSKQSNQSKQSTLKKKQIEKKKKQKINKNTIVTINNNTSENKINTTNNNSLTITKSQNKLINTLSVNLISKLNQNATKDKININSSTKNGLTGDSINNTNNNIKKKEIDEENILTKEMIFERLKILEIGIIKFFQYLCFFLILVLLVYMIIKLIQTYKNINNSQNLFDDYSIVTYEYSMIINYFNNFNLLLINQQMGRETLMRGMQARVENQFKKSEEVKEKSIKNYPQLNKLFTDLNNQEDPEIIKEALCGDDDICYYNFDFDFNLVKKGIDIGLKAITQVIYNMFDDYLKLKSELYNIYLIQERFITNDFVRIDMTLNLILYMVEDRVAEVFEIEVILKL